MAEFQAAQFPSQPEDAVQTALPAHLSELVPVAPPEPEPEPAPGPEPEQLLQMAMAQAQAEGYEQGLRAGAAATHAAFQALTQAQEALRQQAVAKSAQLEVEAVHLALEMAERLLEAELHSRPELVLASVRSALQQVAEAEEIHLHLNPQDLEVFADQIQAPEGSGRLHVSGDPSLRPGECRVTSDAGDIDATRQTRLGTLRQRMQETLDEQGHDVQLSD